jgi:hypothetical protein
VPPVELARASDDAGDDESGGDFDEQEIPA